MAAVAASGPDGRPIPRRAGLLPWALFLAGVLGTFRSDSLGNLVLSFETAVLVSYALALNRGALNMREAGLRLLVDALPAAWMLGAAVYWARTLVPGAPFSPGGSLSAAAVEAGDLRVLFGLLLVGMGVQALRAPAAGLITSPPGPPAEPPPIVVRGALAVAGACGIARVCMGLFGREALARMGLLKLLAATALMLALLAGLRLALRKRKDRSIPAP